jgi:hypothetical protein
VTRPAGPRGTCAVCEAVVECHPRPRFDGGIFPRAHKHPWRKTGTGWPAMCEGVNYPARDVQGVAS